MVKLMIYKITIWEAPPYDSFADKNDSDISQLMDFYPVGVSVIAHVTKVKVLLTKLIMPFLGRFRGESK